MPAQIVIVHDDPEYLRECSGALRAAGYEHGAFVHP
jgi:hypothetical protein